MLRQVVFSPVPLNSMLRFDEKWNISCVINSIQHCDGGEEIEVVCIFPYSDLIRRFTE